MVLRRTLLITALQIKMSSQLTNLVPVLDGTNYQQWASAMQSFLMSQGQWECVKTGAKPPVVQEETKDQAAITFGDVANWLADAEKAMGNIRLRLHHTIGYQFNAVEKPTKLWVSLKEKYGTPGLTRAFIEFKSVMDTVIPNGSDPSPALDKIMSHFVHLDEMKWEIPVKVQGMMILAKAPPSMESIVQMLSAVARDESTEDLTPEKISAAMRASWETHGRTQIGCGQNQQ